MDTKSVVLEIVGYAALVAAMIDFIAVFVWFQRDEPKKAVHYVGTGIFLLVIFLVLVVFQPSKGDRADNSAASTPAVAKQPK